MAKKSPIETTLESLLYQTLETAQSGNSVYLTAVSCAENDDLRREWKHGLREIRRHFQVLLEAFHAIGLNPNSRPHGRDIVGGIGEALVLSMKRAKATVTPEQAELVACEAVLFTATKDHLNWQLLDYIVTHGSHEYLGALKTAVGEVDAGEARYLDHTRLWCRESWIQALGFAAVLPKAKDHQQVQSAIGQSRAQLKPDGLIQRTAMQQSAACIEFT